MTKLCVLARAGFTPSSGSVVPRLSLHYHCGCEERLDSLESACLHAQKKSYIVAVTGCLFPLKNVESRGGVNPSRARARQKNQLRVWRFCRRCRALRRSYLVKLNQKIDQVIDSEFEYEFSRFAGSALCATCHGNADFCFIIGVRRRRRRRAFRA